MSEQSTPNLCLFPECGRQKQSQGFCRAHCKQKLQGIQLTALKKLNQRFCSFPACGRPYRCRGFCNGHYQQHFAGKEMYAMYETQRPYGSPPRIICDEVQCPNRDLIGPCHVFRGHKNRGGYGHVKLSGTKLVLVHRYCWEREIGPIPDKLVIDHQCRNRACCNVDHLRDCNSQDKYHRKRSRNLLATSIFKDTLSSRP